jgi:tRNA threonylcarbamoyladenosine modification (KEOPS) complex Cgi121 subunit
MAIMRVNSSNKHVAIVGARVTQIRDVERTLRSLRELSGGYVFQLFDASMVAGWRHVFHAAVNAVSALKNGYAVSKSLDVEALLYASCRDQISRALKLMGVSKATTTAAVLVVGEDAEGVAATARRIAEALGELDDSVLLVDEAKYMRLRDAFQVSSGAIEAVGGDPYEALTGIIVEKGALLSLRR